MLHNKPSGGHGAKIEQASQDDLRHVDHNKADERKTGDEVNGPCGLATTMRRTGNVCRYTRSIVSTGGLFDAEVSVMAVIDEGSDRFTIS